MIERWVVKDAAIAIIREGLGASDFKARTMLDQAVANGVRLSVGGVLRSRASITDNQWAWGGMGGEGLRHMDGPAGRPIKVSEDDLREWLDPHQRAAAPALEIEPAPAARPGYFNPTSALAFVRAHLQQNPDATVDDITSAATTAGRVGGRDFLREAFRSERAAKGDPVRPGRRRNKPQRQSAEK